MGQPADIAWNDYAARRTAAPANPVQTASPLPATASPPAQIRARGLKPAPRGPGG